MEPDRRAKLKSYAWLTTLAMLLALFVPLASAGAQDDGPDGETLSAQAVAEEGGTLDATPESATNMVDETHTIVVAVTDENGDPADGVSVVGTVDEAGVTAPSYAGGLPQGTTENCTTDDGVCALTFNDDEAAESGKDRIRVFRDDQGDTPNTWDENEDHDFVTKTWVDEDDAADAPRLWGKDRIGTAVDVSQDHWASHDAEAFPDAEGREQAEHVVIARADKFPDALAGTPFAVLKEAPLLLTFPDSLDERTEDELQRVLAEGGTVYLLGGNEALSQNVEARVEELGYEVERLFGATRFQTATDIADEIESEQEGTLDHLFIARSHEFADALAGGAAAANVENFDADADEGEVGAILLTFHDQKHEDTEAYINARPAATTYALGGPVVNPYSCAVDVDVDGDGTTETWETQSRCAEDDDTADEDTAEWAIFGADRQETSRAIGEFFFTDPEQVGLARGDKFPDALTGGAHIGQLNGPILLTQTGALDLDPERFLCYNADTIGTAYIYGGNAAIAPETQAAAEDAASGENCVEHPLPGHWVGS